MTRRTTDNDVGAIAAAASGVGALLGQRLDPSPAFKFYVEVLGVFVAEFTECTGLGVEREVKKQREGGTNDFEWILPGQVTYTNIVLKRGITYSRELWRWFQHGTLDGRVFGPSAVPGAGFAVAALAKRGIRLPHGTNMSIILGTVDGRKAKHWDVIGAVPVKWTGPDLNSGSDQVAVETLELAHHGLNLSLVVGTPMGGFF